MPKHIIMKDQNGTSELSEASLPEFSADDFPNGWSGMGLEASGVFLFILKVEAGGDEFELHASEDTWLGYVISGSGTLFAGTPDKVKTGEVAYSAGDFITFEANTPHGWLNNQKESKILFAKQA